MNAAQQFAAMVAREQVAAAPRHWVRLGTACNNRCVFCLDGDEGRKVLLPEEAIREDLALGRARGAERVVLSGGEASVHPAFVDVIRHARALGYSWVQTISNGVRFADPGFLATCVDAGLDEVTFSVHGHTPQLHDRLTGHAGAFRAVVTATARAVRTRRLVVSVDILMCRENITVLDRIVEMCLGLGVREFDLLEVIPQGRAFDNRDEMLYEPAEHLETLHRVLRLARHPELTIWTNRLPARYLEGFEDLIQDPHKLHDEVRGRERELRAWLDDGVPLPCREPERCRRCFLEPFCAFADDLVRRIQESRWDVLDIGEADPAHLPWRAGLPFGCSRLAVRGARLADWWRFEPSGVSGLILRAGEPADPRALGAPRLPVTLVLASAEQLEACLPCDDLPPGLALEVELHAGTAAWMREHRREVERSLRFVTLRQPGPDHVGGASTRPVDPRDFLQSLDLPLSVSGLPRCLLPGAEPAERPATLDFGMFERGSGRLALQPLVDGFIRDGYLCKSLRCVACAWTAACPGLQVNLARVLGLGVLSPLAGPADVDPALSRSLPGGGVAWDPSRPAGPAPRLEAT